MTRDQLLTKLRTDRDQAAAGGDHGEALILNDRIRDLKEGGPATVERVMQQFEGALANRQSNMAHGRLDPAIISELLELLNPIHGAIDRQIAKQFSDEDELDAPDDREYDVTITARLERDLTQAVCILERRLRDFNPPTAA